MSLVITVVVRYTKAIAYTTRRVSYVNVVAIAD